MNEYDIKKISDLHKTLRRSHAEQLLFLTDRRKDILAKLKKALLDNEEKIFEALRKDLSRPKFESYVTEIAVVKHEIDLAIKSLNVWSKSKTVKTSLAFQPSISFIEPTPKGVVLIISPWNYPFQLSLIPLVSAIAAGNCAIVKPSEIATHSSEIIIDIINDLDPQCFRAIGGDFAVSQVLLEHPFDHIFFTGSTKIGEEVMKKAAVHLTPVTLELGGKSPVIVDRTSNQAMAVKRILWSKCLNAGQTCVAPDYVLMPYELIDQFINLSKKYLGSMFGPKVQESASFGRIINERHFNRLINYLNDGYIALGGQHDIATKFIEPTILINVDVNAPIMNEEIFGPILPIIGIDSLQDAIDFIAKKPAPLALYIFSDDKNHIQEIMQKTISGGVSINDCVSHAGIASLPFGGIRHSGMGQYHGRYGFETFSHMRAVHKRGVRLDNPVRYPPYSEKKLNIAKILL